MCLLGHGSLDYNTSVVWLLDVTQVPSLASLHFHYPEIKLKLVGQLRIW